MQHTNSFQWNTTSLKNNTMQPQSGPTLLEWNIRVSIDVLISITSFVGNSLVLFVIYTRKKYQRTPFEILVANLSITDLLSISIYLTFSYFLKTTSNFTCKFGTSFYTCLLMLSMYLMTAIAMFRCRSILYPFKRRPSIKFTYCVTAGLWIFANAFISPVYVVTIWDRNTGSCIEIWPSQIYNRVYTISLFVVQYVIPLTIITASYIKIVSYLKQHKPPQIDCNKNHSLMLKRRRDIEVIKTSATIVTLYTVLTLPGQIAWISGVVFQNYEISMLILKFSTHLQLLHNCCNPFVYGTISREFRSQLTKAACDIINWIFRRNSVRTVAVHREQGYMNKSLEELEINDVILTSVQSKRSKQDDNPTHKAN
ncbi:RYamide receptor-like [Actinia tenebrosa]|uniref:RYamide receptor-like n=1 Tax=Actinia tenebrosa TaxID=6105 RepID=A0A6P8HME5_ACTTE|nr:RYamide receptor-like [Actinia tenebrosa]